VLAVQKLGGGQRSWRIAATGVVLQLDASLRIVKKLKLVGTPFKVGERALGGWRAGWMEGWLGGLERAASCSHLRLYCRS
jgi:hypothetical protein